MINKSYLKLAFLFLFVFTACKKDKEENIVNTITEANISGSVNLYDESVTQIDNSGMTVTVEGSLPLISSVTDNQGQYTLQNVPFGTYTLVYEKSNYGTFKNTNVDHTAGSSTVVTQSPSLGEKSTTQITNVVATASGNDILLSISTNPAGNSGNARYISYFLSASASVSNEDYTFYSPTYLSQINPREVSILATDLADAGFTSGQTVYVRVYGTSYWGNNYDDADLGRMVFPNLNMNTVNAVSFVVP